MSVEIKRNPDNVARQRYLWRHGRSGHLRAGSGFTYTLPGAWVQSVRMRLAVRWDWWRRETFAAKVWRLP